MQCGLYLKLITFMQELEMFSPLQQQFILHLLRIKF